MIFKANYYETFQEILSKHGHQGWWPAESDWEMMIGAVLVQNTSWTNVQKSITNLKEITDFNPALILNTPQKKLIDAIKPSGFYNAKSKTIKELFTLLSKHKFNLIYLNKNHTTNELRNILLSVTGIGPETADDILLYVFNRPVFIPDSYTRKLVAFLENVEFKSLSYQSLKRDLEPSIINQMTLSELQEFHALIDEYGTEFINKSQKYPNVNPFG